MTISAIDVAVSLVEERVRLCGPDCWRMLAGDLLSYADRDAQSEAETHAIGELGLWLAEQSAAAGDTVSGHVIKMLSPEIAAFRSQDCGSVSSLPAC